MKNEKKNTCLIKYEKKNIAANLVLLIFFVLFYLYYTNNLIEPGSSRQITLQIILGVVGIISYTLAVLIRKFKLKEHHIFLIASIFMGLVYFIAIPLGKGNDETEHQSIYNADPCGNALFHGSRGVGGLLLRFSCAVGVYVSHEGPPWVGM